MNDLRPTGKKTNHKKGIAAQKRAQKRAEAETRNQEYQKLPVEKRIARNSIKVRAKFTKEKS